MTSIDANGFQLLIITRFCYRGKNALKHIGGSGHSFDRNPLAPQHLANRWRLLQTFCLPSILSQANQNFSWVILIDKELPESYKQKLAAFRKDKAEIHVHEYQQTDKIEGTVWLHDYLDHDIQYLVTINHDDDDMLPPGYTEMLVQQIKNATMDGAPIFQLYGCSNIFQWDLSFTRRHPKGVLAAWQRDSKISSCGFGIGVRFPAFDLCALGLRHAFAHDYISKSESSDIPNVQFFKDFYRQFTASNVKLQADSKDDTLVDFADQGAKVLMTNHSQNVQFNRRYELKKNQISNIEKALSIFDIPWSSVFLDRKHYRLTVLSVVRYKIRKWIKKIFG